MGVEGTAISVVKNIGNKVGERASSLAVKTAGRTAELAGKVGEKATEGAKKAAQASEAFAKKVTSATSKEQTTAAVDAVASGSEEVVETTASPSVKTLEDSHETGEKTTGEVDKAKAERVQKEALFKDNLNKRYQALKEPIDEEFSKVEKDNNGFPKDEDKRNEYFDKCTKAKNEAYTAELKATLGRDFETDNPPPNEAENPEEFRKWLSEREAYMNAAEEAKQEAEKVAKATESGAGESAEKQTAEKVVDEEDTEKTKEDTSASMSNAFRLANELEKAENDKAHEIIERKIEAIHNANQKSSPKFKTKVSICKTILIARAVALVGVLGVAGAAAEKVAASSSK